MTTNDLRIGLVGVNAERGWAREAHVPAIRQLSGLSLHAVATRRQESADAAAAAFGAVRAYAGVDALVGDPDVDVVAVAAAVPAHHDWIVGALEAGKDVLTEWPVGVSSAETETIAAVAERTGRHVAVGLQARTNPAVRRARELLDAGAVGRVLSASVLSTTAGFGRDVPPGELYLEDPANGMHLSTIQAAHTLDLVLGLVGPLTSMSSLVTTQFPELRVGDGTARRTLPDHVLVHGRLDSGAALAVEVAGGRAVDDTPFLLRVVGTDATLVLRGGAPRGFQSGLLSLELAGETVGVDAGELAGLPTSVVNVAGVYAALRDDVRAGTHRAPGPGDAVELAHLVDRLR